MHAVQITGVSMKRNAFTLVELIFAIVIIGVLAAVAIPKFKNLKESATVNNAIKMVKDAESSVPAAAANWSDLENNTTYELSDILQIKGKNISYTDNNGAGDRYDINASATSGAVATITFNRTNRTLDTRITCANFVSAVEDSKCFEAVGVTSGNSDSNITF